MNILEPRQQGLCPPGDTAPSSALMSALTTEPYTLQSARSSTIVEANGRSSLFLSAVSGAIVALALVAHLHRLGDTFLVFAFSVLPALLIFGVMSYATWQFTMRSTPARSVSLAPLDASGDRRRCGDRGHRRCVRWPGG
jgi:hypothetical protein